MSLSCVSCSNACRLQRSKSRPIIRSGHLVSRFWSCSYSVDISSSISTFSLRRSAGVATLSSDWHWAIRPSCVVVSADEPFLPVWKCESQGPLNGGGFKRGGFPIWTCPPFLSFFSFLGLSRFFRDFPDLLGDGPGIFPIRPFSLSRPCRSTYEEQSQKGPRHNLDLSRKKVWKPPGLASLKKGFVCVYLARRSA